MANQNLPLRLETALQTHLFPLVLVPCLSTTGRRRVHKLLLLLPSLRGSDHPQVALLVERRNSSVIDVYLVRHVWRRVASVFGKGESPRSLFSLFFRCLR